MTQGAEKCVKCVKGLTEECSLVAAEWMRLNIYNPVSAMRTGLRGRTPLLSLCLRRPGFGCLLRVKRCSLVTRCGRLLGSPDGQSVRSPSGRCRFQLSSLTPPPAVPTWERNTQRERESRNKWLSQWKKCKTNASQLFAVLSWHEGAPGGAEKGREGM